MKDRHVLITGYPGFIARRLVKRLLASDDDVRITVIVEGTQEAAANAALDDLEQHGTGDLGAKSRITIVCGDVTAMDVGLSGAEFRAFTASVTEIFHLAAVHSLSVDKRHAEHVNVHGTGNILALAEATRSLERFVHFSSAYVSGDRVGVILEEELEEGQGFKNAYEATKYQSEVLVRRAASRVPITIIRPSAVVGDSRTGEIDRFDSVYQLAMMMIASPVAVPVPLSGDGGAPFNIVPVDFVIDAVHAIVSRPETIGRTFHVVDPNPLPARRVYELIAERAGKTAKQRTFSPKVTKALLRIPGLERFAAVSHEFIDYLNQMAFYNSSGTAEVLADTGIRCPQFESYLPNLMGYVREHFDRRADVR